MTLAAVSKFGLRLAPTTMRLGRKSCVGTFGTRASAARITPARLPPMIERISRLPPSGKNIKRA